MKFPDLAVESSHGGALHLPLVAPAPQDDGSEVGSGVIPDASLVCLSFRASSQVCEGLLCHFCFIMPVVYIYLVCNHGGAFQLFGLYCIRRTATPLKLVYTC